MDAAVTGGALQLESGRDPLHGETKRPPSAEALPSLLEQVMQMRSENAAATAAITVASACTTVPDNAESPFGRAEKISGPFSGSSVLHGVVMQSLGRDPAGAMQPGKAFKVPSDSR